MTKKLIIVSAVLATITSVAQAANSQATVDIRGNIINAGCQFKVANAALDLGSVDMGAFQSNSLAGTQNLEIDIGGCSQQHVNALRMKLTGTGHADNTALLEVNNGGNTGQAVAQGVGVRFINSTTNQGIDVGSEYWYPVTANKVSYQVAYEKTGNTITAGPAHATATLEILNN